MIVSKSRSAVMVRIAWLSKKNMAEKCSTMEVLNYNRKKGKLKFNHIRKC
jgi:hypothetical protein